MTPWELCDDSVGVLYADPLGATLYVPSEVYDDTLGKSVMTHGGPSQPVNLRTLFLYAAVAAPLLITPHTRRSCRGIPEMNRPRSACLPAA